MREERGTGIDSKCRNVSVEENLKFWKEILLGSTIGLTYCVRAKMGM